MFAAAWTFALSALGPVLELDVSRGPAHSHRTLSVAVPPHAHAYDHPIDGLGSCDGEHTEGAAHGVVCTVDDDAGQSSLTVLAGSAPADTVHGGTVPFVSRHGSVPGLSDNLTLPPTPPPRA
jgi:hypothetical protein